MGDVLLGLLTIVVMVGAGLAVARQDDPPAASTFVARPTGQSGLPVASPSAVVTTPPGSVSANLSGPVLVAGRDLAKLRAALAADSGASVVVAAGGNGPDVLAAGALDGISVRPRAVVLQILAGTRTSVRTTEAINTVHKKWPGVRILVIGPFSSADRKSAAAVQSSAKLAKVTFLDPVTLHWRADDTSATLSAADLSRIEAKIVAQLP